MSNRILSSLALVIVGSMLFAAADLRASAFTVTPVRVLLGQNASSALLSVKNDSTDPIRFQITLKAWNMTPRGDMQLSDTNDLLFFPALMELKPGEQKNVRIGSAFKGPVATERAYRIFFEELPPPQVTSTPAEKAASAQVRVLTKMGVPIFIEPANPVLKVDLTNLRMGSRRVEFDVANEGNSFFSIISAKLTGYSSGSQPTFEKTQDGWYVLAGGTRHYAFDIPAEQCAATQRLRVEVTTTVSDEKGKQIPLIHDAAVAPGICSVTAAER